MALQNLLVNQPSWNIISVSVTIKTVPILHQNIWYHNCQCYWNEKWDSFFKFLISGWGACWTVQCLAIICQNQPNLLFDRTVQQSQPEPIRQSIPANTLSNLPAIHHQYCKDFPASLNEWTLLSQPTYWDSPPNIDLTNTDFTLKKFFFWDIYF